MLRSKSLVHAVVFMWGFVVAVVSAHFDYMEPHAPASPAGRHARGPLESRRDSEDSVPGILRIPRGNFLFTPTKYGRHPDPSHPFNHGHARGFLGIGMNNIIDGGKYFWIGNYDFSSSRSLPVSPAAELLSNREISGGALKGDSISDRLSGGNREYIKTVISGFTPLEVVHPRRTSDAYGVLPLIGFTLNSVVPKIFTPEEGSNSINCVRFFFSNPNFTEISIKIFDITGAEVISNLKRESENENIMVWDGRDRKGNIVRGGIYIYQVEAEGKVFSGTIVVVK